MLAVQESAGTTWPWLSVDSTQSISVRMAVTVWCSFFAAHFGLVFRGRSFVTVWICGLFWAHVRLDLASASASSHLSPQYLLV